MKKYISGIVLIGCIMGIAPNAAISYSQDPRSCADPRTQYPSNPPCTK